MSSPQQISPNGSAITAVTSPRAAKTVSLFLVVIMLCTTTTFITARIAHRQTWQIAGEFVLPTPSGIHLIKGDVVIGIQPPFTATKDATVARSHLDPHRRLPPPVRPRVAAHAAQLIRR